MVIVDPQTHFNNAKKRVKKDTGLHVLNLSIPTYLYEWKKETDYTYPVILDKTLDNLKENRFKFRYEGGPVMVSKADYEFIVQKSTLLEIPRSRILRHLILKYYKDYTSKTRQKYKDKKPNKLILSIPLTEYKKIKEIKIHIPSLVHYCIRKYTQDDEQELLMDHQRISARAEISEQTYYELKGLTKNINSVVIETMKELKG